MKNLDEEQYRVLLKRITSAIRHAKYNPALNQNETASAEAVLEPYKPRPEKTVPFQDEHDSRYS